MSRGEESDTYVGKRYSGDSRVLELMLMTWELTTDIRIQL